MKMFRSALLLAVTIALSACGAMGFLANDAKQAQIHIVRSSFDAAYANAVAAVNNLGYTVYVSDSKAGVFTASKGSGYGSLSEINVQVVHGNSIAINVKINSSSPDQDLTNFRLALAHDLKLAD